MLYSFWIEKNDAVVIGIEDLLSVVSIALYSRWTEKFDVALLPTVRCGRFTLEGGVTVRQVHVIADTMRPDWWVLVCFV